ncbi:hypothetical protein HC256_009262 [Beauveria bassiana]|nr:hypothetical protein HC256_009262 [Beauveria bassiana]
MNHVANNLVLQDIRNVLGLQVVLDMPPTDVKVLQMQVEDVRRDFGGRLGHGYVAYPIGLRSFDIGGMIGGIGNRKHFKGVKAAFSAVEGFGMGCGPVSDALAF